MTPSVIEPVTFRLVAQCLKQLLAHISDQNLHYFVVKDRPTVLIQQVNSISLLPIKCFASAGIREPVQMDHKHESQQLTNLCTNSCFIISLFYASTCFDHCCAHHQEVKIVLYSIWYHHTETSEWSKISLNTILTS